MAKASKMNFDSGGEVAEEESEEGGGSKKLIVIIAIVLLLVGGGAAAYFFLFSSSDETKKAKDNAAREEVNRKIDEGSRKEATKLLNPLYTPAKKYVVNLRDGRHFLTLTLVAALEDPEALLFLSTREPIIDDMIISLLGNLTMENLRTQDGKKLIKREIYKEVNNVFTQKFIDDSESHDPTPVKQILFTEFMLN